MENFNNWSILIEQHQGNDLFLSHIAQLANQFVPKRIHFILLDSKEELPKELLADLPDLVKTEAGEQLRTFNQLVKKQFHPDHSVETIQLKRTRIGHVLKGIAELNTDLLIMSKDQVSGFKNLKQKVARKTGASVLLLTSDDTLAWEHIALPVDFSVYSNMAVKLAKDIQLAKGMNAELNFVHVFEDGSRYLNQVFETVDEVKTALKKRALVNEKLAQYANAKMGEFLTAHFAKPMPVNLFEHGRDKTVAEVLKEQLVDEPIDLMILGSKGKGKSIASLMGDTADEFAKGEERFSVLIVKQKGENKGFLTSFFLKQ